MTDAVEIFLGDIKCELQRFEPKPGDMFALVFPDEVPLELANRLKYEWDKYFPAYKIKMAVFSGGMKVKLIDAAEPKS
jgi:hypothetical protein